MNDVDVRAMVPGDAGAVRVIYQAGLDGGLASFETVAPPWEVFDRARLPEHRLAGVFPHNEPSLRLHRHAGFRVVGTREKVGKHPFDGWRDVVMIERRSRIAGTL